MQDRPKRLHHIQVKLQAILPGDQRPAGYHHSPGAPGHHGTLSQDYRPSTKCYFSHAKRPPYSSFNRPPLNANWLSYPAWRRPPSSPYHTPVIKPQYLRPFQVTPRRVNLRSPHPIIIPRNAAPANGCPRAYPRPTRKIPLTFARKSTKNESCAAL